MSDDFTVPRAKDEITERVDTTAKQHEWCDEWCDVHWLSKTLRELMDDVAKNYIEGLRAVDKENHEHGYDSMHFACVRAGWLASTHTIARKYAFLQNARRDYDDEQQRIAQGTWATFDVERQMWKCLTCGGWVSAPPHYVLVLDHGEKVCSCAWTFSNNLTHNNPNRENHETE